MLVLGAREVETGTVSIRHRDNEELETQVLENFITHITKEIRLRHINVELKAFQPAVP